MGTIGNSVTISAGNNLDHHRMKKAANINKIIRSKIRSNYFLHGIVSVLSVFWPYKDVGYLAGIHRTIIQIAESGRYPVRFKLMYALYAYQIVRLIWCDARSSELDFIDRLIWFDYFRLMDVMQHFNTAFTCLFVHFGIFYHLIYCKTLQHDTLTLPSELLFERRLGEHFLESTIGGNRRQYSVVTVVRRTYFAIMNYQQANTISLFIFSFNGHMVLQTLINEHWDQFTPVTIAAAHTNAALFFIGLTTFVIIANLAVSIGVTTVLIHFIILGQTKKILYWTRSRPTAIRGRPIFGNAARQCRLFAARHTAALRRIIKFDYIFGGLLLTYIVFNLPLNALLALSIIEGNVPPNIVGVCNQFLIGQLLPIFGIHCLAASYQTRIHRPVKRLIHLSCGNRSGVFTVRDRLFTSHYIQMLHTDNRYGVTYGGIAPITILSFIAFLANYLQFLLYIYKIEFS